MLIRSKKFLSALLVAIALIGSAATTVYAATFGTKLNGASSVEILQVRYDGAAWNYPNSGYRDASFKYVRNGQTLLSKSVRNGKVTGSVWDNLFDWSKSQTTKFYWNHTKY